MNLLGYFVLFLLTFLAVHGQDEVPAASSDQHIVNSEESTLTSTDLPTTTPSSASDTTSAAATTTTTTTTTPSTVPTSTQSAEPQSSTPSTDQTTTPGSASSTATPSVEPTTTPNPPIPTSTVAPSPDLNLYVNNSGTFCILMDMEITLTIQYENATGVNVTNSYVVKDGDIVVDEQESSDCSGYEKASEEHLVASFKGANELFVQFNLSDHKVSINLFKLTFDNLNSIFPDASLNHSVTLLSKQKLFEYSNSKSYKCDAENKVDLVDENGLGTNSYVTFKEVKVQAFGGRSDANFLTAEDCVQDDNVSDIVPIAVGCALAALVVIVLIAYLIGRRQKRQRGYESV